MQFSHSFLYGIIKLLYSLENYFYIVFKTALTFTFSTTQSRIIASNPLWHFLGNTCRAKTIYSYPFLLLAIPHSYVDQIICPAPFFKTKGKRNLSRPAEYVPVPLNTKKLKLKQESEVISRYL